MTSSDLTRNVGPDKNEPSVKPSVCLIAEVIGNSSRSFSDAIADGLNRLLEVGVDVHGLDVVGQKIAVSNGRITNYRVVLKVAYDGTL